MFGPPSGLRADSPSTRKSPDQARPKSIPESIPEFITRWVGRLRQTLSLVMDRRRRASIRRWTKVHHKNRLVAALRTRVRRALHPGAGHCPAGAHSVTLDVQPKFIPGLAQVRLIFPRFILASSLGSYSAALGRSPYSRRPESVLGPYSVRPAPAYAGVCWPKSGLPSDRPGRWWPRPAAKEGKCPQYHR